MLFYLPQSVTDDNGPTEVLPGSQHWDHELREWTTVSGATAMRCKKVRQEALRNGGVQLRHTYKARGEPAAQTEAHDVCRSWLALPDERVAGIGKTTPRRAELNISRF